MVRIAKHPDIRREEFLDAALDLATTVGFDSISIEQITNHIGVAKGTFYYHFASKQALLAALVTRFSDQLFAAMDAALPTLTGSAAERLVAVLTLAGQDKTARMDDALASVPLLYKPENYELRHRLFEAWIDQIRPLISPLIDLGHSDGSFEVDDADHATHVILSLWIDASTRLFDRALAAPDADAFADILSRGMAAIMTAAERILGARPGTFALPDYSAQYHAMHQPFLDALGATTVTTATTRSSR